SASIPFAEVMGRVAGHFGEMCAKIGIVIALAALIGQCMMESGAADKVVRVFVRVLGADRVSLSMVSASGVLSIPVFFDTVFYLMVPLARAMRIRTGKNYLLYIMAVAAGGVVTHSLVPPTPGPLTMAANLEIDLGIMIIVGTIFAIPTMFAGWLFAIYMNRRTQVPFRETAGMSLADLKKLADSRDEELPGFLHSLLPIALPVMLITSKTIADAIDKTSRFAEIAAFLGDPNFALLLSAAVSLHLVAKYRRLSLRQLSSTVETAFASGGLIILITAGGGAFGGMLKDAGVGDTLRGLASSYESSLVILVMGFLLSVLFKIAQGSGTVAMTTVSAIMFGVVGGATLDYHLVYLALVIGSGSLVGSWMNDSGFWIFAKMSGLTETEALKSWTPLLAVLGLAGFIASMLGAVLVPMGG
ncbi:MAG: gluconate permease, partial [bacterium]|nr:gluconate permease [bacterium]